MQFSLNVSGTQRQSTYLAANNIYDVAFKGVEVTSGKKEDGSKWDAIDVTFESEDGKIFRKRMFGPTEQSGERRVNEFNGQKITQPSSADQLSVFMAHLGETLSPAGWEKMKKFTFDLPKDNAKMFAAFAKVMAPAVGKKTKLKLVANKQGYAELPYYTAIGRDELPYLNNAFIGENVAFTASEIKKMNAAKPEPKPTKVEEIVTESAGTEDDFDLANLELD